MWGINAGILKDGRFVACQKMKKRNRTSILLSIAFNASVVYSLEVPRYFVTKRLDVVQKSFCISYYFDTKNYMWRLDIF